MCIGFGEGSLKYAAPLGSILLAPWYELFWAPNNIVIDPCKPFLWINVMGTVQYSPILQWWFLMCFHLHFLCLPIPRWFFAEVRGLGIHHPPDRYWHSFDLPQQINPLIGTFVLPLWGWNDDPSKRHCSTSTRQRCKNRWHEGNVIYIATTFPRDAMSPTQISACIRQVVLL